jgi:hypothetical protein
MHFIIHNFCLFMIFTITLVNNKNIILLQIGVCFLDWDKRNRISGDHFKKLWDEIRRVNQSKISNIVTSPTIATIYPAGGLHLFLEKKTKQKIIFMIIAMFGITQASLVLLSLNAIIQGCF